MSKFIPRDEWLKLYEHPKWQKKRLEILEYAEWQCQGCGSADKQLHVHHARYLRGKKPWEYRNGWLTAMCLGCHKKLHGKEDEDIDPTGMQKSKPEQDAEIHRANMAVQCPDHLKPVWAGVIASVRLDRKLISAWVESGSLADISEDVAKILFPINQTFARDFLNDGHRDFLEEKFTAVCGRKIQVELRVGELPPVERATAKFGAVFEMLGKL